MNIFLTQFASDVVNFGAVQWVGRKNFSNNLSYLVQIVLMHIYNHT